MKLFSLQLSELLLVILCFGMSQYNTMLLKERTIERDTFIRKDLAPLHVKHSLVFAITQQNIAELERQLLARSTPGNAEYQQWMSFEEVGLLIRNRHATAAVSEWLENNGAVITWQSVHGEYLKATAPLSIWSQLFNATFHEWDDLEHEKDLNREERMQTQKTKEPNKIYLATEYYIPKNLAPHLASVLNIVQSPSILSFQHRNALQRSKSMLTTNSKQQGCQADSLSSLCSSNHSSNHYNTSSNNFNIYNNNADPAAMVTGSVNIEFLNNLYQIDSNIANSQLHQSVFETNTMYFSESDLLQFQKTYGLTQQAAVVVNGYNKKTCTSIASCFEGNLDLQYMMGIAQRSSTLYWHVDAKPSNPFLKWILDASNTENPPQSNSISWSSQEKSMSPSVMTQFNLEALKLTVRGVTIVVSSGDDGVAGAKCQCSADSSSSTSSWQQQDSGWSGSGYFPVFPASSPYVTVVGATMGPESGNIEIACQSRDGGLITSGGGFSSFFEQPIWQKEAIDAYFTTVSSENPPSPGYNPNGRGYPDVAFIGVAYEVMIQNKIRLIYGTSCAAPVFAAMITLVNSRLSEMGKGPVGFLNPTLYYHGGISGIFRDVALGSNNCCFYGNPDYENAVCCESGFSAVSGWDPTTGWGSISYPDLLNIFTDEGELEASPTEEPTMEPSSTPTKKPIKLKPTAKISKQPTVKPTVVFTRAPTRRLKS